jgi:hypothetical protein
MSQVKTTPQDNECYVQYLKNGAFYSFSTDHRSVLDPDPHGSETRLWSNLSFRPLFAGKRKLIWMFISKRYDPYSNADLNKFHTSNNTYLDFLLKISTIC